MNGTANLGLSLIPTNSPDYADILATAHNALANALDSRSGLEIDAASGAIGIKSGNVLITKAGVAAMTLPLPTAGAPSAAGDDGRVLRIVSTTANAHTVTTPASGLNGVSHIATFAANVGSAIELVAYNGSWWMANAIGITLS
jgi:hypothetical protein